MIHTPSGTPGPPAAGAWRAFTGRKVVSDTCIAKFDGDLPLEEQVLLYIPAFDDFDLAWVGKYTSDRNVLVLTEGTRDGIEFTHWANPRRPAPQSAHSANPDNVPQKLSEAVWLPTGIWRGEPVPEDGSLYLAQNASGVFEEISKPMVLQQLYTRIHRGEAHTLWGEAHTLWTEDVPDSHTMGEL